MIEEKDFELICNADKCETCPVVIYKDCEYVRFYDDLIRNGNCFLLLAAYINGEWNENTKV